MNRCDVLTEDQKEALRHALTMTSEQIAPLLGISKKGVDRRIDTARARLNGMGRREAAELLAREEGRLVFDVWDNVPHRRIPLVNTGADVPSHESSEVPDGSTIELSNVDGPARGGRRNKLDVWQRLGVVLLLMAVFAGVSTAYIYFLRMH